ncbi:MAG: type II secretion system F family protein [Kiritimatiellae bacterium]|nr:type II secretion system F family protein [Kiritimatiellia bacterium]
MTLYGALLSALWAATAALFAAYAALVLREVTYVTLADGRREARSIPAFLRLLLPFAGNLDRFVSKPFFADEIAAREKMLVAAGFEGLLTGKEFVALRFLVPAVYGSAWCIVSAAAATLFSPDSDVSPGGLPAVCILGVAAAYLFPSAWLRGALKKRHLSIMKALPFVLDLLTLSVEAGMDFISALQRNCSTRKLDPLNEELLRMTKEIQIGVSRKEALKTMAERCGQSDLKNLAFALVQADELGVAIGSILRIQSDQLRQRRFDRAEKLAAEAPVKMLGPLMLCIFPAVFIVLLGPVLSQALKDMF